MLLSTARRACCSRLFFVLTFGFAFAAAAWPQTTPFSCTASAGSTPTLRAEGLSEFTGDIVIVCHGGRSPSPGDSIPTANITFFFPANVTSRLLGTAGVSGASEGLLLIDEPGNEGLGLYGSSVPQTLCGFPAQGAGLGGCAEYVGSRGSSPVNYSQFSANNNLGVPVAGSPAGGAPGANVFQGVVSGNSITFNGVPIAAPGDGGTRIFRAVNIRENAAAGNTNAPPVPVSAFISVSGSTALPLTNSEIVVGYAEPALTFQRRTPDDRSALADTRYAACVGVGFCPFATLRFAGNFADAFKPAASGAQNLPGTIWQTESGFFNPTLLPAAGAADFGTRLKAILTNIPAGTEVWVSAGPAGLSSAGAQAILTATEAGPFSPVASGMTLNGVPAVQLPVMNGTAAAVWEVTAVSPSQTIDLDFSVWLNGSPAAGAANIAGMLAPVADQGAFSPSGEAAAQDGTFPVPRFVEPITALQPVATSAMSIASSGLTAGRGSSVYTGTVTIRNTGSIALAGPFQVAFSSLPAGISLSNASGWSGDVAYITLNAPAVLTPGQSATVQVQFYNPLKAKITFTPIVYTGSF